MSIPKELQHILSRSGGVVTTSMANSAGFSNERLRLLANAGDLERVAHGLYIAPDDLLDKMYATQLRRPRLIYSHETALFLHDLTDRDPISYTATLPTGYNAARLKAEGLRVFTVKKELHGVGVVQMTTVFGNTVMTYSLERTICDCIRSRNKMDIAIVADAMKRYARRRDKNLNTLMEMAEAFHITVALRNYMEVLL